MSVPTPAHEVELCELCLKRERPIAVRAMRHYQMATVPAPLGTVPLCSGHARLFVDFTGTISPPFVRFEAVDPDATGEDDPLAGRGRPCP